MKFEIGEAKDNQLLIEFGITNSYKDYEQLSKNITVSLNDKWGVIISFKKRSLERIHKRLYKNSTATILVPSYILITKGVINPIDKEEKIDPDLFEFKMSLESGFDKSPSPSFTTNFKIKKATPQTSKS